MSYTEIYAFNQEGNAYMAGMVRNSWRGAMAVWNIMEERHLPPYVPEREIPANLPTTDEIPACHSKQVVIQYNY